MKPGNQTGSLKAGSTTPTHDCAFRRRLSRFDVESVDVGCLCSSEGVILKWRMKVKKNRSAISRKYLKSGGSEPGEPNNAKTRCGGRSREGYIRRCGGRSLVPRRLALARKCEIKGKYSQNQVRYVGGTNLPPRPCSPSRACWPPCHCCAPCRGSLPLPPCSATRWHRCAASQWCPHACSLQSSLPAVTDEGHTWGVTLGIPWKCMFIVRPFALGWPTAVQVDRVLQVPDASTQDRLCVA
ncbi:hypothetical protein K438DRAFT_1797029 [Mycena galopus ATCC 62051]|nr:hypothetical protein K438DRAFT_1797029 [Mycena galopus ATCC 62051]